MATRRKNKEIKILIPIIIVGIVASIGIYMVFRSEASNNTPESGSTVPNGYVDNFLWCKQGNCGIDRFDGSQKHSAFIRDSNNCATGFAFRGKTQESRMKPRNKDVCVLPDIQLRLTD